MWLWYKTRRGWYKTKTFFSNLKRYRTLLIADFDWDNMSIFYFLQIKLHRTLKHYESGLIMPYVGDEVHHAQIDRAVFLIDYIIAVEDDFKTWKTVKAGDLEKAIDELFDLLKNAREWWD